MGSSLSTDSNAQKSTIKPKLQTNPVVNEHAAQNGFPQPYRDPNARNEALSFPLDHLDLSSLADQELARMFFTAPKLHDYGAITVIRLSKSLVIKGGSGVPPGESRIIVFAAESLHLPVPRVHRTFTADIPGIRKGQLVKGHFIVMDYLEGPTVDECWNTLGLSQRQSVTSQVAAMIQTMQSTTLELPPGPIGGNVGQKFEGPWFTDYGAGPFATLQELEDWCNHKIDVCIRFKQLPRDAPRFTFRRLVLTHQDIAPRNLILDAQGKVWMIDWGLAGVYPPGFEQAVIQERSSWHIEFAEMVLAQLPDRQEHVANLFASIGLAFRLPQGFDRMFQLPTELIVAKHTQRSFSKDFKDRIFQRIYLRVHERLRYFLLGPKVFCP